MTEAEVEVVTETETVAEEVTIKLFEASTELLGFVVELEEKYGDLDSLTLDREDGDRRGDLETLTLGREDDDTREDLEPLGLADSVAIADREGTEVPDTMGDVP